jgi:hypothetical protein
MRTPENAPPLPFRRLLGWNIANIPLYRRYLAVAEQPSPIMRGERYLSAAAVRAFTAEAQAAQTRVCLPLPPTQLRVMFHQVLRKQMHTCTPAGEPGCRKDGHCKHGFPFPPQHTREPGYDDRTQRPLCYRPGWAHRNVVPYHMVRASGNMPACSCGVHVCCFQLRTACLCCRPAHASGELTCISSSSRPLTSCFTSSSTP